MAKPLSKAMVEFLQILADDDQIISLLGIDWNFGFGDRGGNLPVDKGWTAAEKFARLIAKPKNPGKPVTGWQDLKLTPFGRRVKRIVLTQDSHQLHIADPDILENEAGENPPVYFPVPHNDIRDGIWRVAYPDMPVMGIDGSETTLRHHMLDYTKALETPNPEYVWKSLRLFLRLADDELELQDVINVLEALPEAGRENTPAELADVLQQNIALLGQYDFATIENAIWFIGQYQHTPWPRHCHVLSSDWTPMKPVGDAVQLWEIIMKITAAVISKGNSFGYEHFGGLHANVVCLGDESTQLNPYLIWLLETVSVILIGGLALSHCVRATITQIMLHFGWEYAQKFWILRDCTEPVGVGDYPADAERWLVLFQQLGGRVINAEDITAATDRNN